MVSEIFLSAPVLGRVGREESPAKKGNSHKIPSVFSVSQNPVRTVNGEENHQRDDLRIPSEAPMHRRKNDMMKERIGTEQREMPNCLQQAMQLDDEKWKADLSRGCLRSISPSRSRAPTFKDPTPVSMLVSSNPHVKAILRSPSPFQMHTKGKINPDGSISRILDLPADTPYDTNLRDTLDFHSSRKGRWGGIGMCSDISTCIPETINEPSRRAKNKRNSSANREKQGDEKSLSLLSRASATMRNIMGGARTSLLQRCQAEVGEDNLEFSAPVSLANPFAPDNFEQENEDRKVIFVSNPIKTKNAVDEHRQKERSSSLNFSKPYQASKFGSIENVRNKFPKRDAEEAMEDILLNPPKDNVVSDGLKQPLKETSVIDDDENLMSSRFQKTLNRHSQ